MEGETCWEKCFDLFWSSRFSNFFPNKRYHFIFLLEYRLYFSAITIYRCKTEKKRQINPSSVLLSTLCFRSFHSTSEPLEILFLYWSFVLSLDFSQGYQLHTRGTNNIFLFIELIGRFAFQPDHSGRRVWRDWVWANLRVMCLHMNSLN